MLQNSYKKFLKKLQKKREMNYLLQQISHKVSNENSAELRRLQELFILIKLLIGTCPTILSEVFHFNDFKWNLHSKFDSE